MNIDKPFSLHEFTESYGMTLNLKNFESIKINVSATVKMDRNLKEGENAEEIKNDMISEARKIAKDELIKEVIATREKQKNAQIN